MALAAGAGTRLAPITTSVPKPLCPVATRPLLDLALERLVAVGADPAVNAHHHARLVADAVGDRATLLCEPEQPLGTAGALGNARAWIDGRATLVVNADTWCEGSLAPLLEGWDGRSVRVLVPGGGGFGPRVAVVGALLPWRVVRGLEPVPTGLYELVWQPEHEAGRLQVVPGHGRWADCGTPARLLDANLTALGSESVVAPRAEVRGEAVRTAVSAGAEVHGSVTESVLMPGTVVGAGERLHRVIRWQAADGQQTLQL